MAETSTGKGLVLDGIKSEARLGTRENPGAAVGDLFGDARALQQRYGKDQFGAWVDARLDELEANMKRGVVYYDRKANMLHDRAELLAALYRDHMVYVPHGGQVRGRPVLVK